MKRKIKESLWYAERKQIRRMKRIRRLKRKHEVNKKAEAEAHTDVAEEAEEGGIAVNGR